MGQPTIRVVGAGAEAEGAVIARGSVAGTEIGRSQQRTESTSAATEVTLNFEPPTPRPRGMPDRSPRRYTRWRLHRSLRSQSGQMAFVRLPRVARLPATQGRIKSSG